MRTMSRRYDHHPQRRAARQHHLALDLAERDQAETRFVLPLRQPFDEGAGLRSARSSAEYGTL